MVCYPLCDCIITVIKHILMFKLFEIYTMYNIIEDRIDATVDPENFTRRGRG